MAEGKRITVREIAKRLDIGRVTVYEMLEQGIIPAVRPRRDWIITRHAYEAWEKTCGIRPTDVPHSFQVAKQYFIRDEPSLTGT